MIEVIKLESSRVGSQAWEVTWEQTRLMNHDGNHAGLRGHTREMSHVRITRERSRGKRRVTRVTSHVRSHA